MIKLTKEPRKYIKDVYIYSNKHLMSGFRTTEILREMKDIKEILNKKNNKLTWDNVATCRTIAVEAKIRRAKNYFSTKTTFNNYFTK